MNRHVYYDIVWFLHPNHKFQKENVSYIFSSFLISQQSAGIGGGGDGGSVVLSFVTFINLNLLLDIFFQPRLPLSPLTKRPLIIWETTNPNTNTTSNINMCS